MTLQLLSRCAAPVALVAFSQCHDVGGSALMDRDTHIDRAAPGRISPTASMRVARAVHTATTLPDGRALILGGFTDTRHAAESAEAYDPATKRFTALPRMLTVRHSHTATLLPNGKVLIVGGYSEGNATVALAELFDPTSNSFVATGSLTSPRAGHIAVPLPSGKVLIAGGVGPGWSFLASAEVYDPATGRFSRTGDMTVARESHAAVRLSDGRILIVGGHRDRRANITLYASAEMYDATSGAFSRTGDMGIRRHKHDAVLLRDGRVLVTGGSDERDDRGAYSATELFDPRSGTFSPGPAMRRTRYKHNGTSVPLPDGTVLIAGGAADAEIYHATSGRFELVAGDARLAGQFSAATPLADGSVLITGGYGNGGGPRAAAWLYHR